MSTTFTLKITAASKRKLKANFEKKMKEMHTKKLKKLAPVLEKEGKNEIKTVGAVRTGKFLRSFKAKSDGDKIIFTFNRTGNFVKIKGKKLRVLDHIRKQLAKKIGKLYNNV